MQPGQAPPGDPAQALLALLASQNAGYNPQLLHQAILTQSGQSAKLATQHRGYSGVASSGRGVGADYAAVSERTYNQAPRAQHHGAAAAAGRRGRKRKAPDPEEHGAAAEAGPADQELEGEENREEEEEEGGPDSGAEGAAPPQVGRRAAALVLLQRTGVPEDRAAKALQETEEQCADFDAAGWADEAQVWLACNAEFEDERDRLAEAMHASLEEARERKAQETPLEERTPEEILEAFSDSRLLRALRPLCSLASALLQPPLRTPLLRYLQLERRCGKWYPISRHYFKGAAEECAAQLAAQGEPEGSSGTGSGGADCGEGSGGVAAPAGGDGEAGACAQRGRQPSARRATRSSKKQQQQQQRQQELVDAGGSSQAAAAAAGDGAGAVRPGDAGGNGQEDSDSAAAAPPPLREGAAGVLAALVLARCESVEREVYAMPSGDGPPQLFVKAAEGASEDEEECVELLDDD